MKKVISVATTAAMTLSMLSIPAIVCSAAEDTAAVNFVVKDQSIAKGLTTFTVPFSVSESTTLTSAELKLSAEMFFGGNYKAVVEGVESKVEGLTATLSNGTVTVSGSADLKKGQDVLAVTVKIYDKKGNAASAIPENTSFILKVDSAKIGETEASKEANAEASALLFVKSANETEDAAFILGNEGTVYTTKKTEVKVPVTINGSYASFNTRFRASNGAKIKSIDLSEKYKNDGDFEVIIGSNKAGILFAPYNVGDNELKNVKFENEVIAEITVELPDNAVSGQSFKISTMLFDANDGSESTVTPAKMEDADIIYVLKGDTNLNNKNDQVDATYILREALELDTEKKTLLPTVWEKDKVTTDNDEVAYTIANCGMDKLTAAVQYAVDSSADERVNPADATYVLRYLLEKGTAEKPDEFMSFEAYVESLKK